MVRCQCTKRDGKQCTRKGSRRPEQKPDYCWQHQQCKKPFVIEEPIIIPIKTPPVMIKANKPFIQNSNKMVIFDPNLGIDVIKTDQATVLEGVVPGLWEINLKVIKNVKGQVINLTQMEAFATQVKTNLCEWEYEGVFRTDLGWGGLFDQEALKHVDLTDITKTHETLNRFNFGVYVDIGLAGEFEVTVCYDVNGQIVAIRINFLHGVKVGF